VRRVIILPTANQALACVRVCQMLSNSFKDIKLFRFDDKIGYIYILAGDSMDIIIDSYGEWGFINETEL
jgi:hypothetical protein